MNIKFKRKVAPVNLPWSASQNSNWAESNLEEISQHINKYIGKVHLVFHDIKDKGGLHIDIHWVKPSKKFPFHALVTSGISDYPMNVPNDCGASKYSELCLFLPQNYPVLNDNFSGMMDFFGNHEAIWPIATLKLLGKWVHVANDHFCLGKKIQNIQYPNPIQSGTTQNSFILMHPYNLPLDFAKLTINSQKQIMFYNLFPIYEEEWKYAEVKGYTPLFDKFSSLNNSAAVDLQRINVCKDCLITELSCIKSKFQLPAKQFTRCSSVLIK